MQICAVICELNPMHVGHKFLFDSAKKELKPDAVLALMSGNFVQRGEPAILNEYYRSEIALNSGADIALELPTVYSCASANVFAEGAVKVLKNLGCVNALAMGAEDANPNAFKVLADIQLNGKESFSSEIKDEMKKGLSYIKAMSEVTARRVSLKVVDAKEFLSKPNNVLALEYYKEALKANFPIKFYFVKRESGIKSEEIRSDLTSNLSSLAPGSKELILEKFKDYYVRKDELSALALNALQKSSLNDIASCPDCGEGLENRIKEAAHLSTNLYEFYEKMASSRYTLSRIKRISMQRMLGIKKENQTSSYNYARVLGIKKIAVDFLSIASGKIIVSSNDESIFNGKLPKEYEIEKEANRLYSLLTHDASCTFYKKLLTI